MNQNPQGLLAKKKSTDKLKLKLSAKVCVPIFLKNRSSQQVEKEASNKTKDRTEESTVKERYGTMSSTSTSKKDKSTRRQRQATGSKIAGEGKAAALKRQQEKDREIADKAKKRLGKEERAYDVEKNEEKEEVKTYELMQDPKKKPPRGPAI